MGLEPAQLPVPHPSWSVVGELRPSLVRRFGLSATIPVVAGAGDSIACALGAGVTVARTGERDGRQLDLPQHGRERADP